MFTLQKYVRAKSLEEAYELNQNRKNRIIGGMLWLKQQDISINTAIDLSDLGLDKIEEDEEKFTIGTMVTLRQLEQAEELNSYFNNVFEAAVRDIVGVQFRNMATVGGSVYGRFGFSDVLTVLLALDCSAVLYKRGEISLEEFSKMKPDNDILTHIIIRKKRMKAAYSAMRIQKTDFPVLTCATSLADRQYKTVIGARPGRAAVVGFADFLTKSRAKGDAAVSDYCEYVADSIITESNNRGSAEYRKHLAKALVKKNMELLEALADSEIDETGLV